MVDLFEIDLLDYRHASHLLLELLLEEEGYFFLVVALTGQVEVGLE